LPYRNVKHKDFHESRPRKLGLKKFLLISFASSVLPILRVRLRLLHHHRDHRRINQRPYKAPCKSAQGITMAITIALIVTSAHCGMCDAASASQTGTCRAVRPEARNNAARTFMSIFSSVDRRRYLEAVGNFVWKMRIAPGCFEAFTDQRRRSRS
jgi:hypothetical protein